MSKPSTYYEDSKRIIPSSLIKYQIFLNKTQNTEPQLSNQLKRDARVYYINEPIYSSVKKNKDETFESDSVPVVPVHKEWYSGNDYTDNYRKAMMKFNKINNVFVPKKEDNVYISKFEPIQSLRIDSNKKKEEFIFNSTEHNSRDDLDEIYKSIMNSYIHAIYAYVSCNKLYSSFANNWKYLNKNIKKNTASKLSEFDKDIAYTENKGETIKFQFRTEEGYIPKQVYTYVCLHEITHLCFDDKFIGHEEPFPEMLCVLCVAGYELQLFDLSKISRDVYYSNGRPIASRSSIVNEIKEGIDILRERNPNSWQYYQALKERVCNEK